MGKHKGTRNWHAVNAFQRHAGPMNSTKREQQRERVEQDKELEDMKAECKGTKLLSDMITEHQGNIIVPDVQHAWHVRALMYEKEIELLEERVENYREGYDDYREECNKLKQQLKQLQSEFESRKQCVPREPVTPPTVELDDGKQSDVPCEELRTVARWILEEITKRTT